MEDYIIELDLAKYGSVLKKLEDAVCNHGFFMMAPNKWNPETKTLERPLRLSDSSNSVNVSISQHNHTFLHLRIQSIHHHRISSSDHEVILDQVCRMLRLSSKDENDVIEFQKLHPKAFAKGFGRLFRSATLFEDMVKSVLLCGSGFGRTLQMAENMCKLQYMLSDYARGFAPITPNKKDMNVTGKRGSKRRIDSTCNTNNKKKARRNTKIHTQNISLEHAEIGNFPSPREIANMDVGTLKEHCKLGYRAAQIFQLAKKVVNGTIQLEKLEQELSWEKVYNELMNIKGFGPFVCANILMCLGFYHKVPVDSETMRHLVEVHQVEKKKTQKEQLVVVEQIYDTYDPFQCLMYWFELLEYYERIVGNLSELLKCDYHKVTGFLNNKSSLNS